MRREARYGAISAVICLLMISLALSTYALLPQVAVVGGKPAYVDGERLQMEARLVPPEDGAFCVWKCRMPNEAEDILLAEDARLVLDLTTAHHGAVLWPEVTRADGAILRGPVQTLQVETYCLKLELAAMPDKTQYAPGEPFASDGMQVEAVLSDGSRTDVTVICRWADAPLTLQTQAVEVTCLLLQKTGDYAEFGCRVPITVQQPEELPKDDPEDAPEENAPEEDVPTFAPGGNQAEKPGEPNWSGREKKLSAVIFLAVAAVVAVAGIGCLWHISRGKEDENDDNGEASVP